jgi:dihydroxyacid dehydratase/phosphogluconate dehydratase
MTHDPTDSTESAEPEHVAPAPLRSASWFAAAGKTGILHRSRLRSAGPPDDALDASRPVIGIANSWSELTPCNVHFRELAQYVKRGVWQAGGCPTGSRPPTRALTLTCWSAAAPPSHARRSER